MATISTVALRFGLIFVGIVLLGGAVAQLRSGTTYGLAGKGRVRRDEEPGYFLMLLVGRLVLGLASLGAGLLLRWR
ncbi:MAG: hypothetical protein IH616_00325 [Gemmatimonadales bacterium]|jgi:hypothetical protein|nr:hypothetical protein [Gemmatimonadales bacterium]